MAQERIYLATKKDLTVGVNYTEGLAKAKSFKIENTEDKNITGFAGTRKSALRAIIEVIESFDLKEKDNVAIIYAIPAVSDIITNQTYKYWLMTGKNSKGEDIDAEELKLWKKFYELEGKRGMYYTIKNIFDCRIPDSVMENKVKYAKFRKYSRENNEYSRWCWNKVAEIYSDELDNQIVGVQ